MVRASELTVIAVAGAPPLQEVLARHSSRGDSGSGAVTAPQQQGSEPSSSSPQPSSGPSSDQQGQGAAGQGRANRLRLLLVGPEGDWTPEELRVLVEAGAQPVRVRICFAYLAVPYLLAYARTWGCTLVLPHQRLRSRPSCMRAFFVACY